MTFQVTIMFGLGFMSLLVAIFDFVGLFYYDRLWYFVDWFLAAILNWNFQNSDFKFQR